MQLALAALDVLSAELEQAGMEMRQTAGFGATAEGKRSLRVRAGSAA